MNDNGFTIWIGNHGAYNAGRLIDRPLELPMPAATLAATLRDMQRQAEELVGSPCEEFYISDFETIPFVGTRSAFNELSSIEDVNLLAHVMQKYPAETERVQRALAAMEGYGKLPASPLGLANWIIEADDLPYFEYDCDEYYLDPANHCSNEEKFGAMLASGTEWYQTLVDANLEDHFDLESYGASRATRCHLGDEGYVDADGPFPAEDAYSRDEIAALVNDSLQHFEQAEER